MPTFPWNSASRHAIRFARGTSSPEAVNLLLLSGLGIYLWHVVNPPDEMRFLGAKKHERCRWAESLIVVNLLVVEVEYPPGVRSDKAGMISNERPSPSGNRQSTGHPKALLTKKLSDPTRSRSNVKRSCLR